MIEQIAKDFEVHPMTLFKCLRHAEVDEGAKSGRPAGSRGERSELRDAGRRIKLLEQQRTAAYLSKLTTAKDSTRSWARWQPPGSGTCPAKAARETVVVHR
jgi:hypothetical protein